MTSDMSKIAAAEQQRNSRYRWIGEIPRSKTRRLIASSHLLVLSSQMEGGANVISEAIADHTPVLASRIPGSVGLLGAQYPGFYSYGNTEELRRLLLRAETDREFYRTLQSHAARLSPLFNPTRERAAWRKLLAEDLSESSPLPSLRDTAPPQRSRSRSSPSSQNERSQLGSTRLAVRAKK